MIWMLIISYLIGSISGAKIVGKIKGIDFTKVGSGNLGATNVLRTLGLKWALPTLVFDAFKGTFIVIMSIYFGYNIYLNAGLVILGHIYPLFNKFKGGKGISTIFGIMIILNIYLALTTLIIYLIIYYLTGIVSLSVLLSSFISYFGIFVLSNDIELLIFILFTSLVILCSHEDNILRLLNGEEPKTKLFRNKKGES